MERLERRSGEIRKRKKGVEKSQKRRERERKWWENGGEKSKREKTIMRSDREHPKWARTYCGARALEPGHLPGRGGELELLR